MERVETVTPASAGRAHAQARSGDASKATAPSPQHLDGYGTGSTLAGVLVVAAVGLSLGSDAAGRVMSLAFPGLALLGAATLLLQRRWVSYLEFVLWLWLLAPMVRRVVDSVVGYSPTSLVLLTPALVSLLALPLVICWRARVYRDVVLALATAAATFGYGAALGLVQQTAAAALAEFVTLAAPLLVGAFVLLLPDSHGDLPHRLGRLATAAALVLGAYGLVQFFVLPAWDAQWIVDSGITTVGRPEALHVRVFSTLNTAGPFAQTMVTLLLLTLGSRHRSAPTLALAVLVGLASLGLSLLRAAWLLLALALVLLIVAGRLRPSRVAALVGVGVVALLVVGGPIASAVGERFSSSVAAGSQDQSLTARLELQATLVPQVLSNPTGHGLGSTGTASDLAAPGSRDIIRNVDSGVVETLYTLGAVPGGALMLVTVSAALASWRRARHGDRFGAFAAAAALILTVDLLFTDTFKSVYGVMLWTTLALGGRPRAVPPP